MVGGHHIKKEKKERKEEKTKRHFNVGVMTLPRTQPHQVN
jgi:hypothetical protein